MTQIGTVYAQALYSLAAEEGCTEEVLSALSALETSVEQEPEFLRLLSTPNLSKEERCKIIDDSFSGKMPEILLTEELLDRLQGYADEFLIHAVDVEGKASGIECGLVELLGNWNKIPVTYAGGIGNFENLKELSEYGKHHLNYTIGSALDLFGGSMKFEDVLAFGKKFEI